LIVLKEKTDDTWAQTWPQVETKVHL